MVDKQQGIALEKVYLESSKLFREQCQNQTSKIKLDVTLLLMLLEFEDTVTRNEHDHQPVRLSSCFSPRH